MRQEVRFTLIFLLTINFPLFSQIDHIQIRELKSTDIDIRSEFKCLYNANEFMRTEGVLKMRKNHNFKCSFFSLPFRHGDPKKIGALKGKYILHRDTIEFKTIEKSKNNDWSNQLKSSYIIKVIELTTDFDILEKRYHKMCFLIPTSNIQSWEKIMEKLPNWLEDTYERKQDYKLIMLILMDGSVRQFIRTADLFKADGIYIKRAYE